MFKWSIALSNLCIFILMMSLEEKLSPTTKVKWSLTLSSYPCQSKFVKKALKFLTSTKISASIRCNLLLFKCLFRFILLWVIIAISFTGHMFSRWAFPSSTFSLKLFARETKLDIMILLNPESWYLKIDAYLLNLESHVCLRQIVSHYLLLLKQKCLIISKDFHLLKQIDTYSKPSKETNLIQKAGFRIWNPYLTCLD